MRKDYHMHPTVVQDPLRFDRFAMQAIERGIDEVCITDHMPLIGSTSKDRMPQGTVGEYVDKVHRIQEKYEGKLSVKLGIEIDYHPSVLNEIESALNHYRFDYILGSSHLHCINSLDIFKKGLDKDTYAEEMLKNSILAAESGYFDTISHLDMYKWVFITKNYKNYQEKESVLHEERHMETVDKVLDAIKKNDLFLEMNVHFAANTEDMKNIYPSEMIMNAALKKGVKFAYGSDSHRHDHVGILLDYLHENEPYKTAIEQWESIGCQ